MAKPTISQTKNLTHVSSGKAIISTRQKAMEIIGSHGDPGTLNPRGRAGWVLRSTITPRETMMNANSVPMFAKSAKVPISQMPAGIPTTRPAIQVLMCGVLWTGWTLENTRGSRPSRDMANQMRACPYWNTRREESMPTMAPILTHWRVPLLGALAGAHGLCRKRGGCHRVGGNERSRLRTHLQHRRSRCALLGGLGARHRASRRMARPHRDPAAGPHPQAPAPAISRRTALRRGLQPYPQRAGLP